MHAADVESLIRQKEPKTPKAKGVKSDKGKATSWTAALGDGLRNSRAARCASDSQVTLERTPVPPEQHNMHILPKIGVGVFAVWMLWDAWLLIRFGLGIIGTISDLARYGSENWAGTFGYFGRWLIEAVAVNLIGPWVGAMFMGIGEKQAKANH